MTPPTDTAAGIAAGAEPERPPAMSMPGTSWRRWWRNWNPVGLSLDESLTLWERGEQLAAICTRFLDGARERVETALQRTDSES